MGGGVSQVSTTLYNAAFFGGMEILAHTPHQFWISRYPKGREATVSFGGPELVFRNDWDAGVLIYAAAGDNAVTIRFYSSKLGPRVETETGERDRLRGAGDQRDGEPRASSPARAWSSRTRAATASRSATRARSGGRRAQARRDLHLDYAAQDAFVEVGPPAPKPKRKAPARGHRARRARGARRPPRAAGPRPRSRPPRRRPRRALAPAPALAPGRREGEHVFVPSGATILHADLDAFYASVEQRDDPAPARPAGHRRRRRRARRQLRGAGGGRALGDGRAAGAAPLPRGDRRRAALDGLRRGQPGRVQGLRRTLAARRGPVDRRGLPRRARPRADRGLAGRDRRGAAAEVREEVGLPITVGVAPTKFLAKVASAVAKPDGLLVVPPGGERAFLHPLPVEPLWGVGPATAAAARRGIATVGQVARLEGRAGRDPRPGGRAGTARPGPQPRPRPVRGPARRRTVGSQCAPPPPAAGGARRGPGRPGRPGDPTVRRAGRIGRTVVLRLRFGDYTRAARSRTSARHRRHAGVLAAARALLDEARPAIEARADPARHPVANLDDGGPSSWRCPSTASAPPSTPPSTASRAVRHHLLMRAPVRAEHRGLAPWLMPDTVGGLPADGEPTERRPQ